MKRNEAVQELKDVFALLQEDVAHAVNYGKVQKTQYAHRAYVRAEFALLEGLLYQMRQVTLASLADTELLKPQEIILLGELRFGLDKRGHITIKEQFQNFLPNMLFTLRMYAKNHGATFEPDISNHGWEAMKAFVEIRNRITHPKSAASLSLSNKEIEQIFLASQWWQGSMFALFRACNEADAFWRQKLGVSESKKP